MPQDVGEIAFTHGRVSSLGRPWPANDAGMLLDQLFALVSKSAVVGQSAAAIVTPMVIEQPELRRKSIRITIRGTKHRTLPSTLARFA